MGKTLKRIICFRGQRRKLLPEDFTIVTETPEDPKKLTAVNLQLLKSLWLPDVEILNLKTFETLTVLSKLVSPLSSSFLINQVTIFFIANLLDALKFVLKTALEYCW